MCERKENEPMVVYLLRYVAEQPRALMALIGFLAAAYMYMDLMSFVRESTDNMRVVGAKLEIAITKLEHLEREHEADRKERENDHRRDSEGH